MPKQSQPKEPKPGAKNAPKTEPAAVDEWTDARAALALLAGGPVAAGGGDTPGAEAARLGDTRFQTVQRLGLAARIGRLGGNRHLQRVIAEFKPDEEEEAGQSSGTPEPIEGEPLVKQRSQVPGSADSASPKTAAAGIHEASPQPGGLKVNAQLTFASALDEGPTESERVRGDGVRSSLTFGTSIAGGRPPTDADSFGEEVANFRVENIRWRRDEGRVDVRARVFVACRWGVQSLGNTNVAGAWDRAVTADKWRDIVGDLTPSAAGRPRRNDYWARDITARHERFHASDDIRRARAYMPTARAWLNGQTLAAPVTDAAVRGLLATVHDNIEADNWAYYGAGGEARAYADGKSAYERRVAAVRLRATAQGWT